MKVERNKFSHWLLLIISGLNILFSIPFRIFKTKSSKRVVFFYQMHGNSQALAEYISKHDSMIEMYFLAFPEYLNIYKDKHNLPTLNMLNPLDMIKVAQSDVVVTNYCALTLVYYAKLTGLKFVDVWHGLPLLKNQTPKIMNYLNYYSEVWLSSPFMKDFYKNRYQLSTKLEVTGYGRVDKLVKNEYEMSKVRRKYSVPNKKTILIAPTWKHNNPDRSVLPFGLSSEDFTGELEKLAKDTDSFIIFRAHMLSGDAKGESTGRIKALSSQDYPDTEEILSLADIVVTDWSSLAFDFMVTDKPVIFIDGQAPFVGEEAKTRSNPANRFGPVLDDFTVFRETVKVYLNDPKKYLSDYETDINRVKEIAYGDTLDGRATERYYDRLQKLLNN